MGRFLIEICLLGGFLAFVSIFCRVLVLGRVLAIASIFDRDLGFGSSFSFRVDFWLLDRFFIQFCVFSIFGYWVELW